MFTRNFSKHLKDQNWFAVFLDFSVVVFGIFIGLQAADWNQARLDRQEAKYHLNFMYDELSESIISAEVEIERSRAATQNSFQASFLLTKNDWEEEDRVRFEEQIFSAFQLWGPKRRPVSLRRMTDDGKLDLIDMDLQKAILQFESVYVDAIEQTKTSYSYSLVLTPKITESMRFIGPDIVSTAEELTSHGTLRSAVRDKAVWQRIQLDVLNDLQIARHKLKQALEEHMPELILKADR